MSALELDNSGARYVDELAASKGVPLGTPPDVGFFDGALGASGKGLLRGIVAKPAKLLGDAAAPVVRPMARAVDEALGTTAASNYVEAEFRKNNRLLDELKADPSTTGFAGQMLHGLFDIGGSALTLTPEGAAVLEGYAKREELIDKGVDPGTATAAGTVSGAAVFAGVKAPMTMGAAAVGRGAQGMIGNVAVGAGTNLATGVAERGLTHDLLARGGYADMAEQYKPYDRQSMMSEAIMGSLFSLGAGAIEARSARKQTAMNAALTVNKALHAARGTAPGLPVDAKSGGAHRSALEAAIEQTMRGDAVNVPDEITDATFIRPTQQPSANPMAAAVRDAYGDVLPPAIRFAPSDRLMQLAVDQRRSLRFDAPELNEFAASVEQRYGLPGGLINALKNAGEQSGSTSTSSKGARGVMQFMPDNLKKYGVTDASDPVQIIDAAGRYLRDTARQYGGNVDAMIADYNGGPRQARRVLNGEAPAAAETRSYLARVKEYLGRQEEPARAARQPTPEEFAASVGRVAEVGPENALPTFRDGTGYTGEQILPFFDQAAAGAVVPDVLFRIGRVDDHVTAGLRQFLPGFGETMREAQISAQAIEHIRQLQPAIARDLLARLDDGALYADEVLPHPLNPDHALLVLRDGVPKNHGVTMLDVAAGDKGLQITKAVVGPERNLKAARELKARIEASRPKESQPVAVDTASGQKQSASNDVGKGDSTVTPSASQALDMPAAQSGRKSALGDIPEVDAAYAIATEARDLFITMDDGTELSARDALAQADDVIAQAETEARAFHAAITCFLRRGS